MVLFCKNVQILSARVLTVFIINKQNFFFLFSIQAAYHGFANIKSLGQAKIDIFFNISRYGYHKVRLETLNSKMFKS